MSERSTKRSGAPSPESMVDTVQRMELVGGWKRAATGAVGLVLMAACSAGSGDAGPSTTTPTTVVDTVRRGTPESPVPASSLAASQVSTATVPRPSVPPRCGADDVAIWTAQVRPYDGGADAVLRMVNTSGDWCEADLSGSPRLDPDIEPDVWLEAGEWAELLVGPSRDECDAADVVTLAQLSVGGDRVVVPTTAIVPCGWNLLAMFPLDPPAVACSELDAVVTDRWLVVRNADVVACVLPDLVSAGGLGVEPRRAPDPAVAALEPGDLAGYPLRAGGDCVSGAVPLDFDGVGVLAEVVVAADDDACPSIELGAARSVYVGTSGLLGDVDRTTPIDVVALSSRLDPFAGG